MTTLTYTGTVDSLQTSLVSLASNMSVGDFHNIKYTAGETLSPFRNTRIYGGTFKRTGSNYWSVTLEDPEWVPIYGTYRNGTWRWEPLALESDSTTSGIRTEVTQLPMSGTSVNYTASQTGYYTVIASTANTEGTCTAIIQDTSGNTLLRSTAALARWDNITCGLLPLKAGTTIKAVAIFPSGGAGSVMRIS